MNKELEEKRKNAFQLGKSLEKDEKGYIFFTCWSKGYIFFTCWSEKEPKLQEYHPPELYRSEKKEKKVN